MTTEDRTARLTILVDPRKKAVFERLCSAEDSTPSQVLRQLIREYIERKLGRPWHAEEYAVDGQAGAIVSPDVDANRATEGD